jgi:hypothetical protein
MSLFTRLLDDAATFPPGDLSLEEAVPAHLAHRQAAYGDLVGPFVVGGGALSELARIVAPLRPGSLEVALTVQAPRLAEALADARAIAALRVVAVEVALPQGMTADEAVGIVRRQLARGPSHDVPRTFVELPRDERREPLLDALARAAYAAKVRTGGLTAQMYPGEDELASTVVSAVRARVPFKATAGLHHALRNTDPATGFEQHGFLNLLVATGAALAGADVAEVAALLADRDGDRVAARVAELPRQTRAWFCSFGTCSVREPVEELTALGLAVPA